MAQNDVTKLEAALQLGHTGTSRIDDLVRNGKLVAGTEPRTITQASIDAYKEQRTRTGTAKGGNPVQFKIALTEDAAAHLNEVLAVEAIGAVSQPEQDQLLKWLASGDGKFVRVFEYNAQRRKAKALKDEIERPVQARLPSATEGADETIPH